MVYIDDFNAPFGRMRMCHMVADTREELLAMCAKIGVAAKWIQCADTYNEHFDICLSKKKLALQHGAIEKGFRELANMITSRRVTGSLIKTTKTMDDVKQCIINEVLEMASDIFETVDAMLPNAISQEDFNELLKTLTFKTVKP